MANFRPSDRLTSFLLPPSVDEWLPERHLARFSLKVIQNLDLTTMSKSYRGTGSASTTGAAVGPSGLWLRDRRVLQSQAGSGISIPWRSASSRRTIILITTRSPQLRRFLKEIEALFVKVLLLAREMGVLKMGTLALDGTKIHANASRHRALSYEHAGKIEAQLKEEVAELLAKAEAADQTDVPDGMSIPEELARRQDRLEKLAVAKAKIEVREAERYARELTEHEAKLAAREAKTAAAGKNPRQTTPAAGARPLPKDQINLTDEESRIMPVAGGGFEQCYNAEAVVTADSMLVIAADVVQAPNDKQQIEPMLNQIGGLPDLLGKAERLLAYTGYFGGTSPRVKAAGIAPLIAMGRQPHHPPLGEFFCDDPLAPENPDARGSDGAPPERRAGRELYALRKQIPEPVFGIIKSVMGFRQFLLRGINKVRGEWRLVTAGLEFEADVLRALGP